MKKIFLTCIFFHIFVLDLRMTIEIDSLTETLQLKSQSTSQNLKLGNLSPPSTTDNELLVAVRPSIGLHGQLFKGNAPVKKVIENNVLAIKDIILPIKRSLPNNLTGAPLAKRIPSPEHLTVKPESQSLPNSPNRILSQSAGTNSELESALKRVQNNLSQSCFADLRPKKVKDIDSDLTCLNWLQEGNLLNGFNPAKKDDKGDEPDDTEDATTVTQDGSDLSLLASDPLNTIHEVDKSLRKPAYSFSTLIFMAIENAKDKRLPVKEIYQWIQDNFPYFQKAPIGWKNSVRHNLSLNKSFKKVDKEKVSGFGLK